jgi:CrcB protein
MSLQKLLLVGIGGFFGSISRYGLARIINESMMVKVFPFATFTINVFGSFLLGVVYAMSVKKLGNPEVLSLLLGVGFCGGFTTFSTFAWENMALIEQRNFFESLLYSVASFVVAIIAVWSGFSLTKHLL